MKEMIKSIDYNGFPKLVIGFLSFPLFIENILLCPWMICSLFSLLRAWSIAYKWLCLAPEYKQSLFQDCKPFLPLYKELWNVLQPPGRDQPKVLLFF